jgi:hypothetical protein
VGRSGARAILGPRPLPALPPAGSLGRRRVGPVPAYAKTIVRASKNAPSRWPSAAPGYNDAALAQTARRLAEVTPIDADLEEIYLTHWMLKTREYLTVDNPR